MLNPNLLGKGFKASHVLSYRGGGNSNVFVPGSGSAMSARSHLVQAKRIIGPPRHVSNMGSRSRRDLVQIPPAYATWLDTGLFRVKKLFIKSNV
jgi:hypothetical protein